MRIIPRFIMIIMIFTALFSCGQEDIYDTAKDKVPGLLLIDDKNLSLLSEDGDTTEISIAIDRSPLADVNVILIPDEEILINGTDAPFTLTFTTANWSTPQNLTIGAVNDDVFEGNHNAKLSVNTESSDEFFNDIYAEDILFSISDNDGIILDFTPDGTPAEPINLTEGASTTYSVVLTNAFSAFQSITIDMSHDAQLSVSPASVTFTPDSWAIPQDVTVTAVDDDIIEATHISVINHTVTINGITYTVHNSTVTITDNESLIVSAMSAIGEDSTGGFYTVRLSAQPTSSVIVNFSTNGQVNVAPTTLTFTSGNWSSDQTMTVTPVDDEIAEGSHNGYVYHSILGRNVYRLTVPITDDDTAGIAISPNDQSLIESGLSVSFDVTLTSQPANGNDVTITIGPDSQVQFDSTTHTFTNTGWNIPWTVHMTAIDDFIPEEQYTTSVILTADADYNNLTTNLNLKVDDNEICVSNYDLGYTVGNGTPSIPFMTINEAITMANTIMSPAIGAATANILIAKGSGTYNNGNATLVIPEGVSLYGGYNHTTTAPIIWTRSIKNFPTVIQSMAICVIDIPAGSKRTVIDGLDIANSAVSITETYSIRITDSSPVISRNLIYGGTGTTASYAVYVVSTGSTAITAKPDIYNNVINGGGGFNTYAIRYSLGGGGLYNNTIDGGNSDILAGISRGICFFAGSHVSVINNIVLTGSGIERFSVYQMASDINDISNKPEQFIANCVFPATVGFDLIMYRFSSGDFLVNSIQVNDYFKNPGLPDPLNTDDSGLDKNMFVNYPTDMSLKDTAPDQNTYGGLSLITNFDDDRNGDKRTIGGPDPGNGGDGWSMGAYEFKGVITLP